jgi:hypothetical protein
MGKHDDLRLRNFVRVQRHRNLPWNRDPALGSKAAERNPAVESKERMIRGGVNLAA